MILDLYQLPIDPFSFESEICVIGAGAAGLSLARRLVERGRRVLLVESGAIDYEPATADLADGQNIGESYYPLVDSRLRLFGGTTAIWGGRCAELDEIDFERRDWVPFSGWPFDKAALAPYYAQAWAVLGLRAPGDAQDQSQVLGPIPDWIADDFRIAWWQFDHKADRFGYSSQRDLVDHPGITILLHANVTELKLKDGLQEVEHACIGSLRGHRGVIRAKQFVIAAGGIENPRLLLASNKQIPAGIGNDHDVVGRFFMEHPHARGGRMHAADTWQMLRAFGASHSIASNDCAAMLCPSERLQRDHQILNSSLTPRLRVHPDGRPGLGSLVYGALMQRTNPTRFGRALWRTYKSIKGWAKRSTYPMRPWARLRTGSHGLYLSVRAEQAPNLDSRVLLSAGRDALGMPKVALDWRLGDLDKRTVRVMARSLNARLRRSSAGSVDPAEWLQSGDRGWEFDPLISRHAIGGYHHMGTTRMSDNPRCGVVDRDGRVHTTANLWVAGSSVFPTSGWANPTLSIIALSLRLADRLDTRMRA